MPGRLGSDSGFCPAHSPLALPAAATTTTLRTSTAYARAAPNDRSSRVSAAGMHATDEMLMTVAPASAAERTARASVSTSPTPDIS
ncbi:Uncharacterised protein [Mycobacteroides abscessus subsp. abscessus]|nr:Uncharacterised protein [Mycobacteroides abscessus subsp. abscessus]